MLEECGADYQTISIPLAELKRPGRAYPEFWIQAPHDGQPAQTANGVHVAFLAASPDKVHAFHQAALAAGGTSDGEPGPRPHYSEQYYGCFVRDLDGHKIEAMAWLEPASA